MVSTPILNKPVDLKFKRIERHNSIVKALRDCPLMQQKMYDINLKVRKRKI